MKSQIIIKRNGLSIILSESVGNMKNSMLKRTLIVLFAVVVILLVVTFLLSRKKQDNKAKFEANYNDYIMKCIQTNPDKVKIHYGDKDINDEFYVKYLTDIQEGKFDKAIDFLKKEKNNDLDVEIDHNDEEFMPFLLELEYYGDGEIGRNSLPDAIDRAKSKNVKPKKRSDEELAMEKFYRVVFNSNYNDRFSKFKGDDEKYYQQLKDVASEEGIKTLQEAKMPYVLDGYAESANSKFTYKNYKKLKNGSYVVYCYESNLKSNEISKLPIFINVDFAKKDNKTLVNHFEFNASTKFVFD